MTQSHLCRVTLCEAGLLTLGYGEGLETLPWSGD